MKIEFKKISFFHTFLSVLLFESDRLLIAAGRPIRNLPSRRSIQTTLDMNCADKMGKPSTPRKRNCIAKPKKLFGRSKQNLKIEILEEKVWKEIMKHRLTSE